MPHKRNVSVLHREMLPGGQQGVSDQAGASLRFSPLSWSIQLPLALAYAWPARGSSFAVMNRLIPADDSWGGGQAWPGVTKPDS